MRLSAVCFIILSMTAGLKTAHAHHTEQFIQAGEGQTLLEGGLKYSSLNITPKIGPSVDQNATRLLFNYEKGFTKSLSVGARVAYVDLGGSLSGLERPNIYVKGSKDNGLNGGLNLSLNTEGGSGGVQYGAASYGLTLGYEMSYGGGVRLDYTTNNQISPLTQLGDIINLAYFYEKELQSFLWAYSVSYKILSNDRNATNGTHWIDLKVYPSWRTDYGDLITSVGYNIMVNESATPASFDHQKEFALEVSYRKYF